MTIEEFEQRTGYYPSCKEYAAIEQAYADFPGDKDAFCEACLTNKDGIAERIRSNADQSYFKEIGEYVHKIRTRDAVIGTLKQQVERLTQQLEREQEWKPYEMNGNITQADYERLAAGAESGQCSHYMTDAEAISWICDEFDFSPEKITILHEIDDYEVNRHRQLRKTGRKIDRRPVYCATDYHYIRFNTSRWCYEVWNGQLRPFYD